MAANTEEQNVTDTHIAAPRFNRFTIINTSSATHSLFTLTQSQTLRPGLVLMLGSDADADAVSVSVDAAWSTMP